VNTKSDPELVEMARRGDLASFGQLYERHYGSMVGVAYAVLADRHLAEDAAQEAFAVACRDLPRLRHADRFAGWLRAVCRNVARDMAGARARSAPADPGESPADASSRDMPTLDAAGGDELQELVHESVMRLGAESREAVLLHYFSGLSYEQIGRVMGISLQAVHGRLKRARRKIAADLKRRGVDSGGDVRPRRL